MTWSIVDVARMSGVTARTLRHYDAIGLLPPSEVGANGYRRYGREELLRLQEVLVLRELGLPLTEIARIVDRRVDRVAALREQHDRLVQERDRLTRVADTIARTIAGLTGGGEGMDMDGSPEELFEGFDHARYAQEAQERWPAEYEASRASTESLTKDDVRRLQEDWAAQLRRMAALRQDGAAVDDPRVQEEVDGTFRTVARTWTPNATAFAGLGRMYVEDERFRSTFDRVAPGLAEYFRDAMAVYSALRLTE